MAAREPAVAQGIVAAIITGVGLLGVQGTEGFAEIAIAISVASVPLLGALFVRGRVEPVARPASTSR